MCEGMDGLKRKRQASEVDLQGEETDSSLSPKTKKSPSVQALENSGDVVVILDAGAQYGKVESYGDIVTSAANIL